MSIIKNTLLGTRFAHHCLLNMSISFPKLNFVAPIQSLVGKSSRQDTCKFRPFICQRSDAVPPVCSCVNEPLRTWSSEEFDWSLYCKLVRCLHVVHGINIYKKDNFTSNSHNSMTTYNDHNICEKNDIKQQSAMGCEGFQKTIFGKLIMRHREDPCLCFSHLSTFPSHYPTGSVCWLLLPTIALWEIPIWMQ